MKKEERVFELDVLQDDGSYKLTSFKESELTIEQMEAMVDAVGRLINKLPTKAVNMFLTRLNDSIQKEMSQNTNMMSMMSGFYPGDKKNEA